MSVKDVLSMDNLDRHVRYLSGFEKLSGKAGAHRAVEYMEAVLAESGIPFKTEVFDEYLCNPVSSTVMLADGTVLRSRPRSFSLNCPEGIFAPAVYDDSNLKKNLNPRQVTERLQSFRGKIVISHGFDERYAKLLEKNGAAGWIQIWESDEDEIHEDTVSSVWGTPDMDSSLMLLNIPVVCVNKECGERLIRYCAEGDREVFLSSTVETGVFSVEVPVAYIEGQTDEFVLVSGHYDTWYAGAMDNVTANAACLEIARAIHASGKKPLRGIRFAWWAGHSNGRYAGSAWYYDHYFHDLREHCIAQINSDLIGSMLGEAVAVITTGLEGKDFPSEIIRSVDPSAPIMYKRFGRGADQSFWGAEIPYNIMTRYEVLPDHKDTAAPGGSPWWHTVEDTYEKIGLDVLQKEAEIFSEMVLSFADLPVLPVDFDSYFQQMLDRLEDVDLHSDDAFSFSECKDAILHLKELALRSYAAADDSSKNKILKIVAGKMNWLMQTYGSRHGQDLAYAYGMFPHLTAVRGIYKANTADSEFLFYMTEFVRQKNRLLYEISNTEKELENVMKG